jgi:hypothetical protein
VALAIGAMVALAWLGPMESAANAQVDAGLKRALVSFASARALNAVISLAQGTELVFQPLGVGVSVSAGQVLDPVNDLVEQFSNLMLAASVAFGVQKVLLMIGAHWLISGLLAAVAVAWSVLLLRQRARPAWLTRCLVVLLVARFAVPVVTLGSEAVFQQFLARDYMASQQALQVTAMQAEQVRPAEAGAGESRGLLDRFKDWTEAQNTAIRSRFEGLKQSVERATEHMVRLIVIFLLQTVVVPGFLTWALYLAARRAMQPPIAPARRVPDS